MNPLDDSKAPASSVAKARLETGLRYFENLVVGALILLMAVVVLISTGELGWMIVRDILAARFALLSIDQLLEILGLFLMVLIGIELLATMKTYFVEHTLHVEIVVQVALISIARKIIVLEVKEPSAMHLFGLAALLLALAATYYVETRWRGKDPEPSPPAKA